MPTETNPELRLLTEANAAAKYANKAIDRKALAFDFTAVSATFYDYLNLADTTVM